jgi:hypothetical protein
MTERLESLLAELVALQQKELANQERALALQEKAHVRLQEATRRSKRLYLFISLVLLLAVAMTVIAPALNFIARRFPP